MITRIEATNYRCLEKLDVDLPEFVVLVGANGAGKTTLFDIPNLIGDCLQQSNISSAFTTRINDLPPRCSALNQLVFQGIGEHFSICLEAKLPEQIVKNLVLSLNSTGQKKKEKWLRFIRYEVRFEIFNKQELIVSDEHLFLFSKQDKPERDGIRIHGKFPKKSWRVIIKRNAGEQGSLRLETQKSARAKKISVTQMLLALPKVKFEAESDFLASSWFYDLLCQKSVFYQPDLKLLQTASVPGLSKKLMPNAQNLPWLALELKIKNNERFKMWVEHVQTALSQIENIDVKEREEDHHAYFVVSYSGNYQVTSSGLSEGTLRILALTLVPYLNNQPDVIVTEEPENGIHPRAIESVLQSLSSVYDSQVLISSHSPVVLAQTKLEQILCTCLSSNGAATVVSGKKHPQLKNWQGQIDIGALFATGVLG